MMLRTLITAACATLMVALVAVAVPMGGGRWPDSGGGGKALGWTWIMRDIAPLVIAGNCLLTFNDATTSMPPSACSGNGGSQNVHILSPGAFRVDEIICHFSNLAFWVSGDLVTIELVTWGENDFAGRATQATFTIDFDAADFPGVPADGFMTFPVGVNFAVSARSVAALRTTVVTDVGGNNNLIMRCTAFGSS